MAFLPSTIAYLRVHRQCFSNRYLEGEVSAGDFNWEFHWSFDGGTLMVEPSLGRALIHDPLKLFLTRADYKLEPGGDYTFKVRAKL